MLALSPADAARTSPPPMRSNIDITAPKATYAGLHLRAGDVAGTGAGACTGVSMSRAVFVGLLQGVSMLVVLKNPMGIAVYKYDQKFLFRSASGISTTQKKALM